MIKLTGRIRVLKVKAEEGRDTRVIMACLVSCTIRFVGFVFGQEQVRHVTRPERVKGEASPLYCCFTWKGYRSRWNRPLFTRHVST